MSWRSSNRMILRELATNRFEEAAVVFGFLFRGACAIFGSEVLSEGCHKGD